MNNVEKMLLEQQEEDLFNKVVSDDFSCVDSLIDKKDLEKYTSEEDKED